MEGSDDWKPASGPELCPDRSDCPQGFHQPKHGGVDREQQLRAGVNPPAEDHRVPGHPRTARRVLWFLDEPFLSQRVQRLHEKNAKTLRASRLCAF